MEVNDKYIGRILDNRYEILELIGSGGMALVYKARCHRLNRMVAVKILKENLAQDQEFQRRFYTESQAVAMLSHPNIVAVYDVSRSGNIEYIVMELIEGITLKQYINRKGILNWKEALHFSTQITRALSHAHSRGIIHRDIKPHNIMILKDGSVKVADFGIARLLSVEKTMTQEALGSVHYISPEQAKGSNIDARSDIYSLGVVMYEMLTSRLPFVGDTAVSVAIQHISAIPLMPREINPEIPIGLEDITMHAMESDLNMRFSSADEMLYSLEEFRRNPATVFGFAKSDPADRRATQYNEYGAGVYEAEKPVVTPPVIPNRPDFQDHKPLKKPEMTKDEYRTAKKRSRNTAMLIGIFASVLFVVVLFTFIWFNFLRNWFGDSGEIVIIPNFVGQRVERVVEDERYDGKFVFHIEEEHDDYIAEGIIIRQTPIAEREMTRPLAGGIRINLVVSLGRQPDEEMPDLVNMHFSDARNQLNRLGLGLDIILEVEVSEVFDRDRVIETRPAAGEPLARGDTVLIIYSSGPEVHTVLIPNLVGSQLETLETALMGYDVELDIEFREDPRDEGTILSLQNAGREIRLPAIIRVIVSSGPPERTVTIPDMRGSTQSALEVRFAQLDLTPIISTIYDPAAAGTVLQIQDVGQVVTVPMNIEVVVSRGPEPPPPPPPPPDPPPDPPPAP